MWPFKPRNTQPTPSEPPEDTDDQHAADLAASLSQLRSDLAGLRLEWAEVLDKINRWASRQAARERRRANAELEHLGEDGPEMAEDGAGATNGNHPAPGSPEARTALKRALRAQIRR